VIFLFRPVVLGHVHAIVSDVRFAGPKRWGRFQPRPNRLRLESEVQAQLHLPHVSRGVGDSSRIGDCLQLSWAVQGSCG
jgi:hypothetical protein